MGSNALQSPSPEFSWCVDTLIGGRSVRGEGAPIIVENPATGQCLVEFSGSSIGQVDQAVVAARQAFENGCWRDGELRRECLLRLADLLEQNADALQTALILEVGTPIFLCRSLQLAGPIKMLRWFAERAPVDRTRNLGRDAGPPANEAIIRYDPCGVVAAITAYNYPILLAMSKMGAALAAGCTVVLLPSPQTPLATLMMARLFEQAGFPPGVVNVLAGGPDVGKALSGHPDVDKVTFTGSVAVGRQIMKQAAEGLKGVTLELGGKSASIILPDADHASAVRTVHARYLRNAGQGCQSPTRILVHESKYDEFIDLSREAFAAIKVGDPWDPDTVAGPLINEAHRARVEGYVDRAVADGGRVLIGGGRPDLPCGWFMNSTLIDSVSNTSEIAREELFGPVGLMFRYRTVDEAIAIANESEHGLAATLYGPAEDAVKLAPRLNVGSININGFALRLDSVLSGRKISGVGKEMGEDGIYDFLETQFVQWLVD